MCSHARLRADWANCRNIQCGRTPHTAVGVATNPQTRDTPRNRSRSAEPPDRWMSSCSHLLVRMKPASSRKGASRVGLVSQPAIRDVLRHQRVRLRTCTESEEPGPVVPSMVRRTRPRVMRWRRRWRLLIDSDRWRTTEGEQPSRPPQGAAGAARGLVGSPLRAPRPAKSFGPLSRGLTGLTLLATLSRVTALAGGSNR
jgi:hypothetical protein